MPRTFVRPMQAFLAQEAAGGIVMLVAAVVAVAVEQAVRRRDRLGEVLRVGER